MVELEAEILTGLGVPSIVIDEYRSGWERQCSYLFERLDPGDPTELRMLVGELTSEEGRLLTEIGLDLELILAFAEQWEVRILPLFATTSESQLTLFDAKSE